jgi:putative effector of murein hydrolase LrgA (UPF0299 family)
MLGLVLRVVGSLVIIVWGVAHMLLLRTILRGLGAVSPESRRIVIATWIGEGLALIFVGAIVGLISYYGTLGGDLESMLIYSAAGFLFGSALVGLFTKARNRSLPMKLCPVIEIVVAALFIASILL